LASKCGYEIADVAELERLDTLIAGYRPGEIPPMIQAERELNQARIAARSADPAAAERFAAAIATMRTRSTPYHLAHGLLDYAEHLASLGRAGDGSPFIEEARTIGERLGAGPLVLRSADLAEKSGSLLSS
jgi:hypothetical protein